MRLFIILFTSIFIFSASYGCKKEVTPPPKTKAPKAEKIEIKPEVMIQEMVQKTSDAESGYIYKSEGRRDPFVPLIVPIKERERKTGQEFVGTLRGYDISDFRLIAVAKEGPQYYALLATPDNKSFTINEGAIIGLHKGKVKKITSNKVIIIEYSKDYRGKLKPRQIVLELHKGGENNDI